MGEEDKKEKDYWKIGYVHKYHFYYGAAILAIVIVLLTSYVFKSSEFAGSMLSFAATLSSVLLAVIAIIITLIDVSGQKQNVYDMKKEIEKLSKIVNKSSSFSRELESGLSKIEERYKENTNLLSSLYRLVEDSKRDDKPEDFYEKVKDLFNKKTEFSFNDFEYLRNSKEFKKARSDIHSYVYHNPGLKILEVLNHFSKTTPKKYMFFYNEALNDLIFNKDVNQDENGVLIADLPF